MPRLTPSHAFCSTLAALLLAGTFVSAADIPPPDANSPDEPYASELSLERAASFLDAVSVTWTRERKCGTCHTNYAYLLARPALRLGPEEPQAEVRKFFESRAAHWETAKPKWDTEVVATAVALAVNDARTTGKLHPMTRKALDWMWTLQREDGSWDWIKCGWPPMEHDDYFGVVHAAIGVGSAPEKYAESEPARRGIEKLRGYLKAHAPPDPHHAALLVWASTLVPGLLADEERSRTIEGLFALQRPDGGWNLASLGTWNRHDGSPNDGDRPGDGYGTGFIVFVLRQAGIAAADARLEKAVSWLKSHQRLSGRWFTRSPSTDGRHFISHAGSAYAVMALAACGETGARTAAATEEPGPGKPPERR